MGQSPEVKIVILAVFAEIESRRVWLEALLHVTTEVFVHRGQTRAVMQIVKIQEVFFFHLEQTIVETEQQILEKIAISEHRTENLEADVLTFVNTQEHFLEHSVS